MGSFGTWVRFGSSGSPVRLRRDACILHGTGQIALAVPFTESSAPVIVLRCLAPAFIWADALGRGRGLLQRGGLLCSESSLFSLPNQHKQPRTIRRQETWRGWKRTTVGLVVAALLAGTGAAVYVQRSFAALDGKLVVKGLRQAVQVQRDGASVTHIRAQSPQDAWFAMGCTCTRRSAPGSWSSTAE